MFKISSILKRAWQVLWNYKILWIFAFLFALTGGGGGGGGGGNGSGSSYRMSENFNNGEPFRNFKYQPGMTELDHWFQQNIQPWFATEEKAVTTILVIVGAIILFSILVGLLFALVRYPSEAAMMRMVDEHEQTGVKYSFRQGWKLGWTHRAFRMWVIDLILSVPVILFVLILIGLGLALFLGGGEPAEGSIIAVLIAVGCLTLPFVLLMIFIGLLRVFFVRAAALEDASIGESLKLGWAMFKHNWKNALLMWLVMLGIGIGVGLAMILVIIILIPTYAIMAVPGALVAAIPGAIGYGITSMINAEIWPWIIGALLAIPFFFTIAFSPAIFAGSLVQLFNTNVWTLTYRAFKQMPAQPQVPVAPSMPPELPE